MEIKKSKIQKVEMLPEWSNSYGTFFPHKVTFENGDIAITNKVTQNAFKEGQELSYEITGQDNAGNNKFKEIQEEKKSFKKQGSNAAFALSYAKDLYVKDMDRISNQGMSEELIKRILLCAGIFNEWLNKN